MNDSGDNRYIRGAEHSEASPREVFAMFASKTMRRIVLSILVAILLCIIFFAIDLFDGITSTYKYYKPYEPSSGWPLEVDRTEIRPIAWAPGAVGIVAGALVFYFLYIVVPQIVYGNAKSYGRNAVRWTTAFVVFTPFLAGIAYLLTWPKNKTGNKRIPRK